MTYINDLMTCVSNMPRVLLVSRFILATTKVTRSLRVLINFFFFKFQLQAGRLYLRRYAFYFYFFFVTSALHVCVQLHSLDYPQRCLTPIERLDSGGRLLYERRDVVTHERCFNYAIVISLGRESRNRVNIIIRYYSLVFFFASLGLFWLVSLCDPEFPSNMTTDGRSLSITYSNDCDLTNSAMTQIRIFTLHVS